MTAVCAIDLNHLNKYVLGDDTLRDEVLEIFVEQLNTLLGALDPSEDDFVWKNTAHTLKGAARGVGAWDVGDLCQEAETLIGEVNRKAEAREALLRALRWKAMEAIYAVEALAGKTRS